MAHSIAHRNGTSGACSLADGSRLRTKGSLRKSLLARVARIRKVCNEYRLLLWRGAAMWRYLSKFFGLAFASGLALAGCTSLPALEEATGGVPVAEVVQ